MKAISIQDKFSKFNNNWHPHQIAVVDNMQVLLAKLKGEFVWHGHEDEDELFQVIKGNLYMQFRDRTEIVKEGELIVVPRGLRHPKNRQREEVQVLLFEKNLKHTGNVESTLTQTHYPKI